MTPEPDNDDIQMKIIWNSDLVTQILDALNAIVHETRMHFLDDHIRIWAVDPANVAAVFIDLDPNAMDSIQHYAVQPDGFSMGVNTERLDDVMSYADSGIPVQMEFGPAHDWAFNITMPGVDVDLSGIDPESMRNDPDHPRLKDELPAHYTLSGSQLKDAMDLNDMFSDQSMIHVEDHTVSFTASGDTDSGTYTLDEADGETEFSKHPDEAVESRFSLDYLGDVAKVLKGYDDIQVHSGTDFPIMLKTDLFDYMVAPRIDSTK